jgi:hypothetical protein
MEVSLEIDKEAVIKLLSELRWLHSSDQSITNALKEIYEIDYDPTKSRRYIDNSTLWWYCDRMGIKSKPTFDEKEFQKLLLCAAWVRSGRKPEELIRIIGR